MRVDDWMDGPNNHPALTNILPDQHHRQPVAVEFSNTSLVVPPLPGGPATLDIIIPDDAQAVHFNLRSPRAIDLGGARAGVTGIATTLQFLEASTISLGGFSSVAITAYNACYTKVAGALNLSHKIFAASGANTVSLTDAYIRTVGPNRVLSLDFTNYGGGNETLNIWGELQVLF